MKTYFACSTNNILKYKEFYRTIRETLLDKGHSLTRDWLEDSIALAERKEEDLFKPQMYDKVMTAIIDADVCIFDCTVSSTGVGQQIMSALRQKKPTLLLIKIDDKNEDLDEMFISGNSSGYQVLKGYYDEKEIVNILDKFLKKNESQESERKNFYLNGKQITYLEWASRQYDKSQTDIVKEALNSTIENDSLFKKQMNN